MLLAGTERGVQACLFADSPETGALHIPRCVSAPRDHPLHVWAAEVARFVEKPRVQPRVPLDLAGTPFQLRVWEALRQIPPGETRTYSQLALSLGTAPRAIGRACASNPVSVLVPCHRAVGGDGSLRGYLWGVERKAALLQREAQAR